VHGSKDVKVSRPQRLSERLNQFPRLLRSARLRRNNRHTLYYDSVIVRITDKYPRRHHSPRLGDTRRDCVKMEYVSVRTYLSKNSTHTTLFTKPWQIQNTDISVRKEKYIYKQKINRCKVILTTIN